MNSMRTIQRDIVGAFIFSQDEKILLGHAGVYEGSWVVPGGGVEPGEALEQAVIRETLEETGIDLTNEKYKRLEGEQAGQSEKTLRDTGERVIVRMKFIEYLVKLKQPADTISLKLADDFVDARWFTRDELQALSMSSPTEWRLKQMGIVKKLQNE